MVGFGILDSGFFVGSLVYYYFICTIKWNIRCTRCMQGSGVYRSDAV
jgi:hypothetical protein